jgi:hypothetical protein
MIALVLALAAAFLYLLAFFAAPVGIDLVTGGHVLVALALAAMNATWTRRP